ncbi:esterase/lipase family protein [Nocardia terpenica]|uniref:Lipase n=1 Tax=Nocardia terpenica TaxID=455432 RepID=A0A291RQJ2_9NOCA|nr:alpha/beta fold hydrolase [Nocardia terpenica]ATL69806.1 lipase [Nocardia terpenica]
MGDAAAAPSNLPVVFDIAAGAAALARNPRGDAPPPGANDWSCRPTPEHPNPVVLLHGQFADQTVNWQTMSPLLANHGYCVFSTNWGERTGDPWPTVSIMGRLPIEDSAEQVSGFIDRVLAATGASRVDLLTHSVGGLVGGYYVKFLGGQAKVDRFVALAAPWAGSNHLNMDGIVRLLGMAGLRTAAESVLGDMSGPLPEVLSGSAFMAKMRSGGGVAVPGVVYTNLLSRYDEVVVPYTSSIVEAPNVTNIVVQDGCEQDLAEHVALVADRVTAAHVLNALDPAHPVPVPCVPVLPVFGG